MPSNFSLLLDELDAEMCFGVEKGPAWRGNRRPKGTPLWSAPLRVDSLSERIWPDHH
jgi:hypothetical protein